MSGEDHKDLIRKGFDEYRQFINPLVTLRADLAGEPILLVRVGPDGVPEDADGRAIEDFHGTQAFGHRRREITDAVKTYLDTDHLSWYPSRVTPYAGRLARRLCERTGYDNVYFGCTGSDGVEAALKLSRALTRRPRILALAGAYHGCTFGSVALMNPGYLRDPFGPHLPGVEHVAFNDVDALSRAMGDDVAAVVVEPVQGEGGARSLSAPFVEALCELTLARGALLVADEVQTGLGRTGRGILHSATWPRRPEVAVLGKHLGGGLVPLSAMLTRGELFLRAYGRDFASGESHNCTLGTNAVSMVAGLAALDLLTDALFARIAEVGASFKASLTKTLADSPLVEEVRGEGLMMGIKLKPTTHPWLSFEHFGFDDLKEKSAMAPILCHRLYKRGFFCFPCGHDWSLLRLQPRYEVPEETLSRFVSVCREEIAYLEELV